MVVLGVSLLVNSGGVPLQAEAPDALTFFKNYFITGDYVVGGTGLRNTGVNGIATGAIGISGVPPGADVQAAYLYWQVVSTDTLGPDSGSMGAKFRGSPLATPAGPVGKVLGTFGSAACWSSGGGTGSSGGSKRTYTYRADVLRFFDVETDGKISVNGTHAVQVPDTGGSGNATPIALGASLVVVYRAPDSAAPLSAIVIYDGSYTIDNSNRAMSQTIKGFYQPALSNPNARITYIVGSGQSNKNEMVFLDEGLLAVSPFGGTSGNSWDNRTFTIIDPDADADGSLTTVVDTNGISASDCLTFGAIVFKTAVQDTDGDGLLDVWENATAGSVVDPNGQALPPLKDMGADKDVKDVFVEIGYMKTKIDAVPSYGGVNKPAHSHLPSHEALKLVGDSFKKKDINVHFDVGASYPLGDRDDPSKNAEDYIVDRWLARGGEAIDEMTSTLCESKGAPWDCQFNAYPGTVGWKTGFRYLRDEVLSVEPAPLPGEDDPCDAPGSSCTRRFDRNRKDIFHYALFAHALGLPKSESPCLLGDPGQLTGANNSDRCDDRVNPDFRTPGTSTGVGDFPGGDVLVTLGAFSDTAGLPIGTPFMQASTLMHELGHNFERRHSGEASTLAVPNTNCKPTYLSVMNYLYQLRGLLDDAGRPHLDFSGAVGPTLDEGALSDGALLPWWQVAGPPGPYRIGWYAPLAGSYLEGKGTAARSHCDGSALLRDGKLNLTEVPMVRIDARKADSLTDWNANGNLSDVGALDINFNGRTTSTPEGGVPELLRGSNDWANLHLNQVGSRRSVGGLYIIKVDSLERLRLGPMSLDSGRGDYGRGDYGRGDYGRGDYGRGDYGRGDLGRGDYGRGDYGRGDYGRGDYGRGDYGRGDYGGGDLFVGDPANSGGELDFELASDLARTPPNEFRACVLGVDCPSQNLPLHDVRFDFKASNLGGVARYLVYRVAGADLLPAQAWTLVGQQDAGAETDYVAFDDDELVHNAQYTYFAVAEYLDGVQRVQSDASNLVTITAVNDPLVAGDDTYDATEDTPLRIIAAEGVLANDVDADSPRGTLTAARVSGPSRGTLTLNTDGSFTYTPALNFNGVDTFTYTASDGAVTTSATTVTITVASVNDLPVAGNDAYTTVRGSALTIAAPGVLANDSDVDGTLTAVLVSGPANGTLTLGSNGSFTYTPGVGFSGTDSFSYQAWDGTGGSTATVTLSVLTYVFTGFLSPMVTAGTESAPSNAGVFSYGKAIPLKWSLTLGGVVVSDLASLKTLVAVPGTYSSAGTGSCAANVGTTLQLMDSTGRPTGNSTYRFSNGQFIFNWDTSAAVKTSCYVIKLTLNDGSATKATIVRFR